MSVPARRAALAATILVPLALVAGIVLLGLRTQQQPAPEAPTLPPPAEIVIDFPRGWSEIPGKLSRTYRSFRPGAGLLQLSIHPSLPAGTDAPATARELATMLDEMETEMEFGERLEISHADTKAGPLAFARFRSPAHGVLGFWLLASDQMIFATYVDGGPETAEKDITEAHKAFLDAHLE